MSGDVHGDDAPTLLAARRARFVGALATAGLVDRPFVVHAGRRRARNYPANAHRYRADSHFLHLVGEAVEGAVLELDGDRATLHVPRRDDTYRLFHGESEAREAIAERTGLRVVESDGAPSCAAYYRPSHHEELLAIQRSAHGTIDEVLAERLSEVLVGSRLVHDELAVRELRASARLASLAHVVGMAVARPGLRASAVRAAMTAVFEARGCDTAYPPIVTTCGEVLHRDGSDETLRAGDLLLADVGCESRRGYASDVTRTYPVTGRFEAPQRDWYEAVLVAQRAAFEAIAPGVRFRAVHDAAVLSLAEALVALGVLVGDPRERAADHSVALFFPHGIGHLLGLDVHDLEGEGDLAGYGIGRSRDLDPTHRYLRFDRPLEVGMAFTIEPGLYQVPALLRDAETRAAFAGRVDFAALEAFGAVRGIRVEDDVLLGEDGPLVLTERAPKSVADLEALVGRGVDFQHALGADPSTAGDDLG